MRRAAFGLSIDGFLQCERCLISEKLKVESEESMCFQLHRHMDSSLSTFNF